MKLSFISPRLGLAVLVLTTAGCTTDLSAPEGLSPTRDLTGVVLDQRGLPVANASISLLFTPGGSSGDAAKDDAKPHTGVAFSVPNGGAFVRVEILNALHESVRVVLDDRVDEGEYTAAWDGSDDKGKPAPNGLYRAQLEMFGPGFYSLEEVTLLLLVVDLDDLVERPNARTDADGRFVVPRDLIPIGEEVEIGKPPELVPISSFVTVQAAVRTADGVRRSIRDIQIPVEGDLPPLEFLLP